MGQTRDTDTTAHKTQNENKHNQTTIQETKQMSNTNPTKNMDPTKKNLGWTQVVNKGK
jgi:hypothetical protein